MIDRKAPSRPSPSRGQILAAAERLLAQGDAEFSMRDLAAEAGVSFATPFNQFGGKLSIMRALSATRIEQMHQRVADAEPESDALIRTLNVVAIAADVMTSAPAVNRAVMGAIGAPGAELGEVRARSRALWARALGDGAGLASDCVDMALMLLPDQLANGFRGVLSFWTAGEIEDGALVSEATASAAAVLLGVTPPARRRLLLTLMNPASNAARCLSPALSQDGTPPCEP